MHRGARIIAGALVAAGWAAAQCVMCARTAAAQQTERAAILNHAIYVLLAPALCIFTLIIGVAILRRGR